MNKWAKLLGLLVLLGVFALAGCDDGVEEEPLDGDTGSDYFVERIDVQILESFPVQVQAVVSGNLPDGCTEIVDTNVLQVDNTFEIAFETERPADAMCTEALEPFQETVSIPVEGLPAGSYTIAAGATSVDFTLDVDNVLPEE